MSDNTIKAESIPSPVEDSVLEQARLVIDRVDHAMAELFEERMAAAAQIGAYKKEKDLPIRVPQREALILERNSQYLSDPSLRGYYREFLQKLIDLSCTYQESLLNKEPQTLLNEKKEGRK